MHISDGALSPAVWTAGYALTAAASYIGLRTIDYSRLTTAAVLASVFFVGSLVHVPLGPGSAHLILNGLLGLFLGWAAFPALLVALLLQAILFRFGGIAALGVNTFAMALPALVCHYAFRPLIRKNNGLRAAGAFCCGALSAAGGVLCAALALGFSDAGFVTSAKILFLAHVPVMALEGIIATLAVAFIAKSRPELLCFSEERTAGVQ